LGKTRRDVIGGKKKRKRGPGQPKEKNKEEVGLGEGHFFLTGGGRRGKEV